MKILGKDPDDIFDLIITLGMIELFIIIQIVIITSVLNGLGII